VDWAFWKPTNDTERSKFIRRKCYRSVRVTRVYDTGCYIVSLDYEIVVVIRARIASLSLIHSECDPYGVSLINYDLQGPVIETITRDRDVEGFGRGRLLLCTDPLYCK